MSVGVSFFVATIDTLTTLHGPKLYQPDKFNRLIELLGDAERIYQQLPADPDPKPAGAGEGKEQS